MAGGTSAMPTTIQLGVLTTNDSYKLQKFPVPQPGQNEILIANVAVASNPKDWKFPASKADYAGIEGNDVAGRIAGLGDGVTEFKLGDRVAALTKLGTGETKVRTGEVMEKSFAKTSSLVRSMAPTRNTVWHPHRLLLGFRAQCHLKRLLRSHSR